MTQGTTIRPAVFAAQPAEYQAGEAADLVAWERELVASLNLDLEPTAEAKQWVRGETISGSGNGWDDSDFIG
ncbi:hypothetical protein [Actinospica robiniae]|uniref:hypothetical protein n=1 Tax=Actinospica robiniae TaxID=304901 RepID=UPI00041C2186|nr:hypothetical protein [Actinospica robiniae]